MTVFMPKRWVKFSNKVGEHSILDGERQKKIGQLEFFIDNLKKY
jgi:hypothetical protein